MYCSISKSCLCLYCLLLLLFVLLFVDGRLYFCMWSLCVHLYVIATKLKTLKRIIREYCCILATDNS